MDERISSQAAPQPAPQPAAGAQPIPQPVPAPQPQPTAYAAAPQPQPQPMLAPQQFAPAPAGTPVPQPAPAPVPAAQPQRHRVHHSYIWLGTLKLAGVIVAAMAVSSFSSLAGLFLEGGSGRGFGVLIAGLVLLAVIALVVGLCLAYQWWSYRHLWYEIGDEEFSFYSGIFNKKRVHVPYQRVQSVDQQASLLQRVFGVCTVSIDTAGGASHTAVRVPYVRKDQAERLRMELYLRKRRILGLGGAPAAQQPSAAPVVPGAPAMPVAPAMLGAPVAPGATPAAFAPAAPAAVPGNVLDIGAEAWDDLRGVFAGDAVDMGRSSYEYGLTNKELVFTGLSNSTGLVLIVVGALAAVFQTVGGALELFGGNVNDIAGTAVSVGTSLLGGNLVLFGIIAVLLVLAVMWGVSVLGTCIQYGGFKARRRGSRIEVEHGLLQHRISGVDVDRVQSVAVKQSVIRRLIGYCELSLGKIDAADASQGEQGQGAAHPGIVIHPFVKVDRVPEILAGLVPEFADMPQQTTPLPRVALRRAIVRRAILQGAGFWLAVAVALVQIGFNLMGERSIAQLFDVSLGQAEGALGVVNTGAVAAYAVCAVIFALEVAGAVLWARGSGFSYNRRFMKVVNGGLSRESVSFPRRKIQFGFTKTNPFQRRARTATIAVRTAAGTGGTTVRLVDVYEDDARAWLEWVRPGGNAVS